MALRRWFGFRQASGWITDVVDTYVVSFGLNSPNINDGDTIERALCGYRVQTALNGNSGPVPTVFPRPWGVSYSYVPTPDGESESDVFALGGDALFRDFARWQAEPWTDGTTFSTRWHADSGGMISMKGGRKIIDKTVARIDLGAGWDRSGTEDDPTIGIRPDFAVMLWIEIMVQRA